MEIQTFEIEESIRGTCPEEEAKAVELIERLQLEGQRTLVRKDGATRFQYPEMTLEEKAVYQAVFPARTPVEKYSHGIIPVRVLQVVSHAKEFCTEVEVWHKVVRDPDPLLVGFIGERHKADRKTFILARWGDALKQFGELVKEARQIIRQRFVTQLEEAIATRQAKLAGVDGLVDSYLQNPESVHIY